MIKKYLYKLLTFSIILALCFFAVGCSNEDERYMVAFKIEIARNFYVMDDETEVMHIQIPYDGEKHCISLDSWSIPKHPDKYYNEHWYMAFKADVSQNRCLDRLYFVEENGNITEVDRYLKEKGHYIYLCEALTPSDLWDYQYKLLHIYYI